MIFSILPWTIYLGFTSQCVISGVTKGAGWCLAVAAFPIATVGLLLLLVWIGLRLCGRGNPLGSSSSGAALAGAGGAGAGAVAYPNVAYYPVTAAEQQPTPVYPTYTAVPGAPVAYYGPTPAATPMLSF